MVKEAKDSGLSQRVIPQDNSLKADKSCKDCRARFGYSSLLDYVELCPLHAAAPTLYDELTKARDTFADLILTLRLLGRTTMANACQIAKDSADATLALAEKENSHE